MEITLPPQCLIDSPDIVLALPRAVSIVVSDIPRSASLTNGGKSCFSWRWASSPKCRGLPQLDCRKFVDFGVLCADADEIHANQDNLINKNDSIPPKRVW